MIEPDGSGTDEFDTASFQQLAVALCTGTGEQGIRIFDDFGSEGFSRKVYHFIGQLLDGFADVRYFVVYDYFHVALYGIGMAKVKKNSVR